MRKLIVLEHLSLDGVIQAPGGKDEDPSGGFTFGGWTDPYSDPVLSALVRGKLDRPCDLLLGRKTFDIWEPYWPHHGEFWPAVNQATKYVASNTRASSEWQPSVFLHGDVGAQVAEIKRRPGPDLNVWGSGELVQTLLKHDLVDTLWLIIYPLTLGAGKRLFAGGSIPAAFTVTESTVTPNGVIVVNYERSGAVQAGSF